MAAYGAAISLKNTIKSILQSPHISLVPPSSQILQAAYDEMSRLQIFLLELDHTRYSKIRTKVNALDEQIKVVVWAFEDVLEAHFTNQILQQLESSSSGGERDHLSFSLDLQCLRLSVDYLLEMMMVMEVGHYAELQNMPEEEDEPICSRINFGGINSEMVGLSDQFKETKDYLLAENEENWCVLTGMAGVGKTALAKKVFDDPSIQRHFEFRAWVKVGRKCEPNELLRCILAQVDPNTHDQMFTQREDDDDEKLLGVLVKRLKDKKSLIVLDDVWEWDTRVMDHLPAKNIRIMLTSRLRLIKSPRSRVHVRLLNLVESKKLLGEKVFGQESFPPHLEELGEKIAYKCEGLPLMIVTVAELLSNEDKTLECWTEVVQKQRNSIFMDAYNLVSEVLFPSYDYLPQYLKMLFLYLGAFRPYRDIDAHKVYQQLSAEGFLEPIGNQTLEDFISICMNELIQRHYLVLFEYEGESWFAKKKFRVHSCWQHVCQKEASKIKFLHVLQDCDDVIKAQRRLCAHCNTLFAFKGVYDSIKSDCGFTTRSLLCYGPYHQYPVPIHAMDFKLLRVLDAFKVRFYHIPAEILKLVCLKYLALTCNNELPTSVSNLFQLKSLILHQYPLIKNRGVHSYIPVEIWNMQELQHIDVNGRDLPTPNSDVILGKLYCLASVSPKSCTREILKRTPNLKRLRIVIELKPYDDDDSNSLSDLDYISVELKNLDRLVYHVENPEMMYVSMLPLSMFPSSLQMLELTGLGCPWKHMNDIGLQLPNLKNLQLNQYAFRGPEWDIILGCFLKLETLIIEDSNLVRWRAQHGSLPRLELLSIRHCYKLRQLDWMRDPSMATTPTIELVECNPYVVDHAKQLVQNSHFTVRCHSSFLDDKSYLDYQLG